MQSQFDVDSLVFYAVIRKDLSAYSGALNFFIKMTVAFIVFFIMIMPIFCFIPRHVTFYNMYLLYECN